MHIPPPIPPSTPTLLLLLCLLSVPHSFSLLLRKYGSQNSSISTIAPSTTHLLQKREGRGGGNPFSLSISSLHLSLFLSRKDNSFFTPGSRRIYRCSDEFPGKPDKQEIPVGKFAFKSEFILLSFFSRLSSVLSRLSYVFAGGSIA